MQDNTTHCAQWTSLDFIRKLLINGFLREMDLKINENNKNITFPKLIYEECFKFFPRFDIASLQINPLLNLNLYVAGCYLTDVSKIKIIHESTQRIRKILSIQRNPPIDTIIECGITPRLIEFLSGDYSKFWELQFEAAWSLTNICSGTSQHVLHVMNAIPLFINLLTSESVSLQEQSIWALGNICGDSTLSRNTVLHNNILDTLIPLIQSICNEMNMESISQEKKTLLRNAAWTVSNLCRGKPSPNAEYVVLLIPILNSLLAVDDTEVIVDTLWAYSYLTDGATVINHNKKNEIGEGRPNDGLNIEEKKDEEMTVLDFLFLCDGVMNTIIGLLSHSSPNIVHPSMRILGNICTSNDNDTQKVLDQGILDKLYNLLKVKHATTRAPIKREALWTISNIMAGNEKQIQCVIDKELIPVINDIMLNSSYELSKEAVWCIGNALSSANERQIDDLVLNQHIIPNISQFVDRWLSVIADDEDNKRLTALRVAFEGIEKILSVENGKYALYIEQHGLVKQMERLLHMFNDDMVVTRCKDIINTYFSEAPSQIIHLNISECCLILSNQLKCGSIQYCTRIIECDNMIKHLLMNLADCDNNDVFIRNDIVFIISDLFVLLDSVNAKTLILRLIDYSVILPFVDFLLYLMQNEYQNKDEINMGKTMLIIMEIIAMILKYKNDNLTKFYLIKYDAVYAMKQMINDNKMLYSIENYGEIINISSSIMKEYFSLSINGPNYEKTLVNGYFREMNVLLLSIPIHIMETCCYYGYDYSAQQNKRRLSQTMLQTSVSNIVQFDFDDDDVLLDLDFGF